VILVVGATGAVGSAVVRGLRDRGEEVAALVRPATDATDVEATGAQVRRGDLTDSASLVDAVSGVDVVVATANAIVPRRGERPDFEAIARGYLDLARHAREAGARRLIVLSVPSEYMGRGAVEFDVRARIEARLRDGGPPLTIARASLFMESWLTAVGSRLPVRGAVGPTIDRGFWLARFAGATSQTTLDRFGLAQLPGGGRARHAFICVPDVADALVFAALAPDELPDELRLGGPDAPSWREVVEIYGRVLDRRLRTVRQPSSMFGALSFLSRRLSPAAAHLLAVQRLVGVVDTPYPPDDARRLLGRDPVSVETFLRERLTA
jgi:uncharacterized protein YbjT (DUF2867 family)